MDFVSGRQFVESVVAGYPCNRAIASYDDVNGRADANVVTGFRDRIGTARWRLGIERASRRSVNDVAGTQVAHDHVPFATAAARAVPIFVDHGFGIGDHCAAKCHPARRRPTSDHAWPESFVVNLDGGKYEGTMSFVHAKMSRLSGSLGTGAVNTRASRLASTVRAPGSGHRAYGSEWALALLESAA